MRVNLTDRDRALFTLVGLCGYVSTAQVARALFPSVDRARRRVRSLYDAGYVAITLAGSTVSNLVSLTPIARDLLLAERPELEHRVRLAGTIRLAGVPHHLLVVDTRLYLASLTDHSLVWWGGARGAWARQLGLPRWHVEPDGIALVERAGQGRAVFVEADTGTESSRVIESKLGRYRAVVDELVRSGYLPVVLFITSAGKGRAALLSRLVVDAGLAAHAAVLMQSQVVERPARAWRCVAAAAAASGLPRDQNMGWGDG